MKKVYLIKMDIGNTNIILPRDNSTDEMLCFKSKKELQKYIDINAEYGDDKWKYCHPVAVPVFPRDCIAGEYMYIDRIDYGVDYDFDNGTIFNKIQFSQVVYPSKEILKYKSGLYEYTMNVLSEMDEKDRQEYVNEDDHIYNRYTRTTFDCMAGYIDYKIYQLKIV